MLANLFASTAMKVAGIIIAVLLLLLAVQSVRLDGLSVWPLRVEGWKPRAERLERDLAQIKAAQQVALERAEAAQFKAENRYRNLAGRIDYEAHNARVDARAAADRYIAAFGLRCEADGSSRGGTVAATEDHTAGYPVGAGRAPELDARYVAVSPDDVRICSDNTVKAQAAREWASGLDTLTGAFD